MPDSSNTFEDRLQSIKENIFRKLKIFRIFMKKDQIFNTITEKDSYKGALSGLRQLFATVTLLKMMKNAFYLTFKALCFLKIFKFLS